jgi:hypothetical protein
MYVANNLDESVSVINFCWFWHYYYNIIQSHSLSENSLDVLRN